METAGIVCPHCGYDNSKEAVPEYQLPLHTILGGKYMLGKVLGEGGFGITYIAYDLNMNIVMAVKEYYPNGLVTRSTTESMTIRTYGGEPGEYFKKGRERFVDEAKRLARFRDLPGIVAVTDFLIENGTAYIVMEFVEGQTLKSYLEQMGGRLPPEQVFDMMAPVFGSLAQIHENGIIHRDISPDNIMISPDGSVKLLDFGAAREFHDLNKSLSVMLKHGYAPMEQYTSKGQQGPFTDVYALSATIYMAITGMTPENAMDRLLEESLEPPSKLGIALPDYQEAALIKGLAVRQADRFQSVSELYTALICEQEINAVSKQVSGSMKGPDSEQQPKPSPTPLKYFLKKRFAVPVSLFTMLVALFIAMFLLANRTQIQLPDTVHSDQPPPVESTPPPLPSPSPSPSPATITILYNTNGGDTTKPRQSVQLEDSGMAGITLPAEIPLRDGYTFIGWQLDGDTTQTLYDPGQSTHTEQYNADDVIIFYALWKQDVERIDVDSDSITLELGETYQINARIYPPTADYDIRYSASGITVSPTGLIKTPAYSSDSTSRSYTARITAGDVSTSIKVNMVNSYATSWPKEQVKNLFSASGNDTKWDGYPLIFDNTVPNCTGFRIGFIIYPAEVNDLGKVNLGKDWLVYVKADGMGWKNVGTVRIDTQNDYYYANISFSSRNVTQVYVVPPTAIPSVYGEWYPDIKITDLNYNGNVH